ncbi:YCF49-like protein [Perilla frutescens var. frutescens]|nr:YCF49-like protein [Perilla frutescens var. frutescens]
MVILNCLPLPQQISLQKLQQPRFLTPPPPSKLETYAAKSPIFSRSQQSSSLSAMTILIGAAGITIISLVGPSCAAEFPTLTEPSNALSLPTWAVHVSSVVEWATAMGLVWQYGEKSGYESWKGLSWGMVPLLGGALCACTWHFFYNSESLEILVALQAALTVIGNATMCIAAYRIYTSSQERSKNP